jgi:hypothetical protein
MGNDIIMTEEDDDLLVVSHGVEESSTKLFTSIKIDYNYWEKDSNAVEKSAKVVPGIDNRNEAIEDEWQEVEKNTKPKPIQVEILDQIGKNSFVAVESGGPGVINSNSRLEHIADNVAKSMVSLKEDIYGESSDLVKNASLVFNAAKYGYKLFQSTAAILVPIIGLASNPLLIPIIGGVIGTAKLIDYARGDNNNSFTSFAMATSTILASGAGAFGLAGSIPGFVISSVGLIKNTNCGNLINKAVKVATNQNIDANGLNGMLLYPAAALTALTGWATRFMPDENSYLRAKNTMIAEAANKATSGLLSAALSHTKSINNNIMDCIKLVVASPKVLFAAAAQSVEAVKGLPSFIISAGSSIKEGIKSTSRSITISIANRMLSTTEKVVDAVKSTARRTSAIDSLEMSISQDIHDFVEVESGNNIPLPQNGKNLSFVERILQQASTTLSRS